MARHVLTLLVQTMMGLNALAQPAIDWTRSYGGSENDSSRDIVHVSSGGYMVASVTYSTDGDMIDNTWGREIWLMRLDENGELIWQNWYGEILTLSTGLQVQETIDGGFIVATSIGSDATGVECASPDHQGWIFKVNATGDLMWEECYGGSANDGFRSIELTTDGGVIISGGSSSSDGHLAGNNGLGDIWVLRLDMNGAVVWSRNYGGTGTEGGLHAIQTTDGGFLIGGGGRSNDLLFENCNPYSPFNNTTFVLKLDESGEVIWRKCYGGNGQEETQAVAEGPAGTYWVIINTWSTDGDVNEHHGEVDGWLIKLDQDGNLINEQAYGGSSDDYFLDLEVSPLGDLNIVGYTRSVDGDVVENHGETDGWIFSITEDLEVIWKETFGGSDFDFGRSLTRANDGGIVFCGNSASMDGDVTTNNGLGDAWIVKLKPWETTVSELPDLHELHIHPNPTDDHLIVDLEGPATIKIFGPLGRCVISTTLDQARNTIPVHDLASGTYQLHAIIGDRIMQGRFVKQ